MLKQNGCLRGTQEQFNRRDFIRVGSLGFLGINLSQALRLEAAFKQINEKSEKKAKELTDQVLNEFKGSKIVDTADDQVASV